MLAKVNLNKIAEEMDMRREETRKETRRDGVWSVWCLLCGVCAQVHDFHVFFFFLHIMVVVPFDLPQRVIVFFRLAAVSSTVSHVE